ncbi:sensor histidine kinase, partial [bacterium]|nr:sensor histidine kinase [bacterium]
KNDIDEATSKLKSANSKLRLEDQNKDDFISMASHQLRTPLTSVKGYISMLLDEDAGKINKTQREMLDQAFYASSKMVYLIADLLNISRLKSGKFVITPSQINLNEIVSQEIDQLKDNAKSHQIKINFTKSRELPDVSMDETKTRQVIMNFLDNAIYYTPPGGNIEVKLSHDDTSIELKVIDSGMGVPHQDQHHLFTKFYRGSNAKKVRPDGTGIGLYMAKKIILAQGGVIIFSSNLGKGSTFGFKISKKGYTV